MAPPPGSPVTQLITRLVNDESDAAAELFPLVYDQLRGLADRLLRGERGDHTLQPTALVHEAYVRLADTDAIDWRGKARFAALAAKAMRQILVDHARRKKAQKRGGDWERITLQGLIAGEQDHHLDVMALDQALERFAKDHPRPAHIVELRFFANMTGDEIAEVVGVSRRTVVKDLRMAQAWLLREMDQGMSAEA